MNTVAQSKKIDKHWLKAKGWTVTAAAAHLNLSINHISTVLRGERQSASLMRRLKALPKKTR